MTKTYKAIYDGKLEIGENYLIDSAVLDDENRTRVLSQTEIIKALGRSQGGSKRGQANLPRWISASNLTPYISEDLRGAILNPIVYKTTNGNVAHGIEATKLIDVCEVWLNLERSGNIHESQRETARRAYVLTMALAKTSIIALVDEATGYDWNTFNKMVNKAFPKFGQDLEINFPETYDEINPIQSDFDNNLKKGLDFNPKKEDDEEEEFEIV